MSVELETVKIQRNSALDAVAELNQLLQLEREKVVRLEGELATLRNASDPESAAGEEGGVGGVGGVLRARKVHRAPSVHHD